MKQKRGGSELLGRPAGYSPILEYPDHVFVGGHAVLAASSLTVSAISWGILIGTTLVSLSLPIALLWPPQKSLVYRERWSIEVIQPGACNDFPDSQIIGRHHR